ncbi:MAG: hypothetical protein HOO96_08775 [Polyangiaceae bacterium]|nr:hypothetical protein [Polyangiaceae bacterium]
MRLRSLVALSMVSAVAGALLLAGGSGCVDDDFVKLVDLDAMVDADEGDGGRDAADAHDANEIVDGSAQDASDASADADAADARD